MDFCYNSCYEKCLFFKINGFVARDLKSNLFPFSWHGYFKFQMTLVSNYWTLTESEFPRKEWVFRGSKGRSIIRCCTSLRDNPDLMETRDKQQISAPAAESGNSVRGHVNKRRIETEFSHRVLLVSSSVLNSSRRSE